MSLSLWTRGLITSPLSFIFYTPVQVGQDLKPMLDNIKEIFNILDVPVISMNHHDERIDDGWKFLCYSNNIGVEDIIPMFLKDPPELETNHKDEWVNMQYIRSDGYMETILLRWHPKIGFYSRTDVTGKVSRFIAIRENLSLWTRTLLAYPQMIYLFGSPSLEKLSNYDERIRLSLTIFFTERDYIIKITPHYEYGWGIQCFGPFVNTKKLKDIIPLGFESREDYKMRFESNGEQLHLLWNEKDGFRKLWP